MVFTLWELLFTQKKSQGFQTLVICSSFHPEKSNVTSCVISMSKPAKQRLELKVVSDVTQVKQRHFIS